MLMHETTKVFLVQLYVNITVDTCYCTLWFGYEHEFKSDKQHKELVCVSNALNYKPLTELYYYYFCITV